MLNIALPKGRIAEQTLDLFSKIFGTDFNFADRKLIMESGEFRFFLVRSQDVPTYVDYGAADIGVVGLDVIKEHNVRLANLLDLGIGKCRVMLASEVGKSIDYTKPLIKIATKMPNITRKFFAKKALPVEIIKLYGSIELAPLVGLADGIIDIVETGSTLKQNNLKIDEVIFQSSAHLVANKNSFYAKTEEILGLVERLKAIV